MDMEKQILPVKTTGIVEELQISVIEMFGNRPRTQKEINDFGAYIFGPIAQQYYEAKKQAGLFPVINDQLEVSVEHQK